MEELSIDCRSGDGSNVRFRFINETADLLIITRDPQTGVTHIVSIGDLDEIERIREFLKCGA